MFVLRLNFPAKPCCEFTCHWPEGSSAVSRATFLPARDNWSPAGRTTPRHSALQCATVMPATVWLTTPEFSASKIQDYIWKSRLEHFSRFISAGNEQIPHAEMNRFLTRKWTDSSRGNEQIPHAEIGRFLARKYEDSSRKCCGSLAWNVQHLHFQFLTSGGPQLVLFGSAHVDQTQLLCFGPRNFSASLPPPT